MGKYKLTWRDIKLEDFKIYLFAMFKAFIPKKKIKNLDELENFDHPVFLRDNYSNTEVDLTLSDYQINLQPGNYFDRYTLAFTPLSTLSTEQNELYEPKVYYNGVDAIEIYNHQRANIDKIEVYNAIGQLVLTKENTNNERLQIPFTGNTGVYIVVLKINNTEKSTKILIY